MKQGLPVHRWTLTEGLQRIDTAHAISQSANTDATVALEEVRRSSHSGIYIFCDLHPFLEEAPKNIRLLKEIALHYEELHQTVILISHELTLPGDVQRYSARFELSLPNEHQLMALVRQEAQHWSRANGGQKVKSDQDSLKQLVKNLRGLTYVDARRLARRAIYNDGAITMTDLSALNKSKFEMMDMEGVLSYEYDTAEFSEVGGLSRLKEWLGQRKNGFFEDKEKLKVDPAKGILLLGIQGGGKSLAAKAVAGAWELPLLRLDFGALYNKFFGETEKNLRESLSLAGKMSPCVLWLDEIEKGISVDGNDNGISKRLLGTLLTWMAERKAPVFMVATANDISKLPPELIRKGRFDEIFFVDLPEYDVRKLIFEIHLNKRNIEINLLDLEKMAHASEGFSGAEIEQVVVASLYTVAARQEPLTTTHIIQEINQTSPLSVVMEEQINGLRTWAKDRTVPAH